MKKYSYKYCVYLNNCCAGVQFLKSFDSLAAALNYKENIQKQNGCADVVRKRFKTGDNEPINYYIGDNYKYSEYDLPDNCFIYG